MIKLSTLKHQAVLFLLSYLCLSVMISLTIGSFYSVAEANCEYQDANLIWRNTPTFSAHDIKAMTWYKGKGSLIATWLDGKGFVEYPPYIGRLMQIGQTGIKIRTANRSDSGTYWLSLTLASVDHTLEASTHLDVTVTPSSHCKPRVTPDGSFLKADLPAGMCGTPHLTPIWRHSNKTVIQKIQNSSSILDLGRNPEPGEYIVCAEGESARCYNGNISDLCTSYYITDVVQNPPSDHESRIVRVFLAGLAFLVVAISAIVVVMRCRDAMKCRSPYLFPEPETLYRKSSKFHFLSVGENTGNVTEQEDISSIEESKSRGEVLLGIQNHLSKLYKSMIDVSLSPTGEEGNCVNVSNLNVNINVGKVEFTDLNKGKSDTSSDTPHESQQLINKDEGATNHVNQFCPIIIFGDCGSGKSTWCKHLVNCWLQKTNNKDANIQGLNLPDIRSIKILLYLPLQFSDRGLSLQDLLQKYLFIERAAYQEFVMKYVERQPQDILIIIDGLDIIREYSKPISELLHDELIFSCAVILTSRPVSFKLLQETCHNKLELMKVFRVREMDTEDSKQFARGLLKCINHLQVKNFEKFWEFIEHFQVQTLLKGPYICLLMLYVWMENKDPFIDVTDILLHIISRILRRAMTDHQRKELIEKAFDKKYVDVTKYITKLNQWPILMQNVHLLRVVSDVAAEIFFSEIERKNSQLKFHEIVSITKKNYLQVQVLCETGLLTESFSTSTNRKVSNLSFFDRIIFEFFVSIFIALQEGKECESIVSSVSSCSQNSMIIHMLFQLSGTDTVVKYIMGEARKSLEIESRNSLCNEGRKTSNDYSIIEKSSRSESEPVRWLQWLMYNDVFTKNKLLFLTPALHCINNLTSLVLVNQENNKNIHFHLPLLPMLEILTLDIQKCTLLLCKEWNYQVPRSIKEVVIRSVNISTCTLGLLIKALCVCADLERLELFPSLIWTGDDHILPDMSSLVMYPWNKLSESIHNNKKLKTLKLQNLNLLGEVDTLLSHLNLYQNLESVYLGNLRNSVQQKSSESHSPDTDNVDKPMDKIKLSHLELEKINILYSPIDFLFHTTKTQKLNVVKNNLKVLSISSITMPEDSWEAFGNQISALTLTELHLSSVSPKESLKILLEGIGKCEKLRHLSLCEMEVEEIARNISFLAKMKKLLKLHMERMTIAGPSLIVLLKGISECKMLHCLSFCYIDIEEIPETLSKVQKMTKLSELIVNHVTIKKGYGSLSDFLNAFGKCKDLKIITP